MEIKRQDIKISPSIICMDFLDIRKQVMMLNNLADSYHFDIIDNHFAPHFGLPIELLSNLKTIATIPIDVHLIVDSVEITVEKLILAKPDILTVHIEGINSCAFRVIRKILDSGIKIGVAINPITPIESLNYVLPIIDKVTIMTFDPGMPGQELVRATLTKVSTLSEIKFAQNLSFDIEVDGSCNEKNFQSMVRAGANQFVVGTSGLFCLDRDIETAWRKMSKYMEI